MDCLLFGKPIHAFHGIGGCRFVKVPGYEKQVKNSIYIAYPGNARGYSHLCLLLGTARKFVTAQITSVHLATAAIAWLEPHQHGIVIAHAHEAYTCEIV